MHVEHKSLEQKNHELAGAFREKAKHQQQLQKLYTQLKQQQIAAGMEFAAEHDAENVLHAVGGGQSGNANYRPQMPSRASSIGSGGRRNTVNPWQNQAQGSRGGYQTSRTSQACSCGRMNG